MYGKQNQQGGYPPQGQQGGYPPQQGGYPPQQGGYPPQGQHNSNGPQGGYPPQQGGYPPQGQPGKQGGYPPQGQPGKQGGYPPQQGGYPPQGQPGKQGGYPPQQGGYPPQGQHGQPGGYPPQGQHGQPGGYPPQQGGYPPQGQQGGYPPQQGYPPQGGNNWYSGYYGQIENQYMQQLRQSFAAYDKDGSGSVAAQELRQMNINGTSISLDTAKSLVFAFDLDGNGTIDFNEFACLNQFVVKLINAFHQVDTDRSGRLDNNEIKRALEMENLRFSAATITKLMQKVSGGNARSRTRDLDIAQFLKLSALLAQLRAQFNKKNTRNQTSVSLTLEDLITIYADVR